MWIKFWKTWRNGGHTETYRLYDEDSYNDDDILYDVESWGESVSGGQSYGFKYGFEKVVSPPKEWIDAKIKSIDNHIKEMRTFKKTLEKIK